MVFNVVSFHFEIHCRFRKLHPILRVLCKEACSVSEHRKLAEFPQGCRSYYFLLVELILLGTIQFFVALKTFRAPYYYERFN